MPARPSGGAARRNRNREIACGAAICAANVRSPATAAAWVGWRLIDSDIPEKGNALMLFAPTAQTESDFDVRELRLISGSIDRRYSLPDTCIGAAVWDQNLYAVSATMLFRASLGDNRFSDYKLPLEKAATRYIGALSNGNILVACDNEVYVCTLPQGTGR